MAGDPLDALEPLAADPAGSALLFDVDGTLAPIVAHPDLARVPDAALALLARLVQRYRLVGCVSGRSLAALRALVPVEGLALSGNHGLELAGEDGGALLAPETEPYLAAARALAGELRGPAQAAGAWVEDKGPTLTLHWREAPDPAAAEAALAGPVRAAAARRGFSVRPARMALELRPPVPLDKGTAVRALLARRPCRRSLYCGDDTTDIDAFREVDVAVAVVSSEAPAGLVEAADLVVPDVLPVLERLAGA